MAKYPYVGITGFVSEEQVASIVPQIEENAPRKLMLGVLVSYNTLFNPTKYPMTNQSIGRFARVKDIESLFDLSNLISSSNVLNIIHYCDSDRKDFYNALTRLTQIAGKNLHGFQLNMRWPDYETIKKFKDENPDKIIILQMEKQDFLDYDPEQMSNKLVIYKDVAEHVILDMSMGAGIQLDSKKLIEYAYPISIKTGLNIVFAGGLCARNLNVLNWIIKEFPNASIDAEARLMDAFDTLDIEKCYQYLTRTMKLFK